MRQVKQGQAGATSVIRRGIAVGCALGLLTLAVPAVAGSDSRRATRADVTISSRAPAFSGKVKAAGSCKKGRRVQLFRRAGGKAHLIGRDRSNSRGQWAIPVEPLRSGAYYAKAKPSHAGGVKCKAGRSGVVVID
jgi:hypothetical protein